LYKILNLNASESEHDPDPPVDFQNIPIIDLLSQGKASGGVLFKLKTYYELLII